MASRQTGIRAGWRKLGPRMWVKTSKQKRRAYRKGRAVVTVVPGYTRTGGNYGRYGAGGELKFHDVDLNDGVIDAAGTVTPSIALIAQGTTEVERDGRKCTIKAINWRYTIALPEQDAVATPATGDVCRVIMYLDKQANGATIAVTDLLESADYQSFNNLANSSRFRILMDKTHYLNYSGLASDNAGVVSQGNIAKDYTFFKKCSIPMEFSGVTGAVTEIRSNNIGVLLISKIGALGFASKIRLRFQG